ncbi:hypothetical protein [uncultured Winogradskyella sp.]|uniref:hypothetical protein n=1 Tax=uncultured Winogradskyella sp. TaxID=395353 RepID=UPI0030DD575C|tara:strand:- start:46163 stop:46729 length:567 start_codon:yes stop_codon:yes gene_type:complete
MDNYFNFKLSNNGTLSKLCLDHNLITFEDVCHFITHLPYGRNTNRSDYISIIKEHKGTCSTKHAFLKQLGIEQHLDALNLCIGIYKMNLNNTPGVATVLSDNNLSYIPEAHTYLKYKDTIIDVTTVKRTLTFYDSLLYETIIQPHQIGVYKLQLHKQFLKSWIEEDDVPYNFETLWNIREACILALSK